MAIGMLLSLCVNADEWGVEIHGIKYDLKSASKTAKVANNYGYTGVADIPSSVEYNGIEYSVIEIGSSAFADANVTGLTSVIIPNSVNTIGYAAFDDCNSLWSVNITNLHAWCKISFENHRANPLTGPRNQSQSAARLYLNGSEVKELVIPNNVTSIKPYAFTECQGLRAVTIPNSVTSIETSAFYNCDNLTTVNIESNGTTIGNYVFSYCI